MFKKTLAFLSSVCLLMTAIPFTSLAYDTESDMRNITTAELVEEMGIGINLGNTFESCGDWIAEGGNPTVESYETAWGSPVITEEIIQGYADAGFGVLRVPVAWSNLMGDDYTISSDYLAAVKEVVDWAIESNLYVILNIHYDNGWFAKFPTEKETCMYKYTRIWTQLCDAFADYGDYLMFESLNEEGCWDSVWNQWTGTDDEKVTAFNLLNEINQKFVDIVRSSGGNNPERHLLIAGYATNIGHTCDDLYKMPDDPINRCAVSVHYYTPPAFAILEEDADWAAMRSTWGTDADFDELNSEMDKMKEKYVDNGIPVIIGEYGCPKTNKDADSVRLFIKSVCEAAYSRNMCPVLWDITGLHYDRDECKMVDYTLRRQLMSIVGINLPEVEEKKPLPDNIKQYEYNVDDLKKSATGNPIVPIEDAEHLTKAVINITVSSTQNASWCCGGGALTFNTIIPKDGGSSFWSSKSFNYSGGTKNYTIKFDGYFNNPDDKSVEASIGDKTTELTNWWKSSAVSESGDDVEVTFNKITLVYEYEKQENPTTQPTTSQTQPTTASSAVYGDANCDGKVDISDAVMVKCYLINNKTYGISAQGLINADVQGNGNGVNAQDAVTIQKYVIKIITALPV